MPPISPGDVVARFAAGFERARSAYVRVAVADADLENRLDVFYRSREDFTLRGARLPPADPRSPEARS